MKFEVFTGKAEKSGKQLVDILGRLPIGIAWGNSHDGNIRYVNKKFVTLFGYSVEELGTMHDWISHCYVNPEQARRVADFLQAGTEMGSTDTAEIPEIELDIRCRDGSVKTVLSSKIILPEKAGALSIFLDITPRKENEKLLRQHEQEDPLTGLMNRQAFSKALATCMDVCDITHSKMALLILDLDGFRMINDSLGYDQGDDMLKQVSERVHQSLRDEDYVCRMGGDEFCVLVTGIQDEKAGKLMASRIMRSLSRPYSLPHGMIELSASIGLSLYPDDGDKELYLFQHADAALSRAKLAGKGCCSR